MSAVYKLSSDPRYHLVSMPPRMQRQPIGWLSSEQQEAFDYWKAVKSLPRFDRFNVFPVWSKYSLERLAMHAARPAIAMAAYRALEQRGYSVEMLPAPGPIGGGAA